MRLATALLVPALLALPARAAAQDFGVLEGLFDSINSISFSVQAGGLTGSDQMRGDCGPVDLCGMGTEVFLNLASTERMLLEIALGTGYVRGFSSREPSIDIRGSVRSVPTVGVYVSHLQAIAAGAVVPYAGVQVGFSELWNVQAYDEAGDEYAIEGSTYELGASTGLAVDRGPLDGLFVEGSYRHRRFPSIDWASDHVEPGWPREIDLSAWFVSIGWQFDIDLGDE